MKQQTKNNITAFILLAIVLTILVIVENRELIYNAIGQAFLKLIEWIGR